MYTSEQKQRANFEWSKGKVFGCPLRVKTMQDVEQVLSELTISNDRIIISKFDSSFLASPVKMQFKQEHFKTARCPADLIFMQCVALNKLDQIATMIPDLTLVKLLSYKQSLKTLL